LTSFISSVQIPFTFVENVLSSPGFVINRFASTLRLGLQSFRRLCRWLAAGRTWNWLLDHDRSRSPRSGRIRLGCEMLEARECPSVTITEPFQDLNYVEGEQVNLQIAADFTGSNPNRSYSAELPSFLSIDSTTGVISGSVPYQAAQGGVGGVYGIAITATDLANQESDTKSFSWSFANTNQSPSQTSLGDLANYEGDSISISLASGVDPDGQSLTYSIDYS